MGRLRKMPIRRDLETEGWSTSFSMRSVLYYFQTNTNHLTPVKLPPTIKIREVAVGSDHVIAVTTERAVYTWGHGRHGQLGHGNTDSLLRPRLVDALKGKSITRACCGDGFSVFASDNGIVMTCGDGSRGCLGHGDWCSAHRPRLIEALLSVDVVSVSCGAAHVVSVGSDGEVHAWGCGQDGRLGHGLDTDSCSPVELAVPAPLLVRDVRCGRDGTMLLTDVASVLACGNNANNKLGLNQRQGFLMAMKNIFNKPEVESRNAPTLVKALTRHRVLDVSMGADHTAILVEPGHVVTMGRNNEGQLGVGNSKPQNSVVEPKHPIISKGVARVRCGDSHTVICNHENVLFQWGAMATVPVATVTTETVGQEGQKFSRQTSVGSLASIKEMTMTDEVFSDECLSLDGTPRPPDQSQGSIWDDVSGFRPIGDQQPIRVASASGKERPSTSENDTKPDYDILLEPKEIFRCEIKRTEPDAEMVYLSEFCCHGNNIFLLVDTTAPPPRRKPRKRKNWRRRSDMTSQSQIAMPTDHHPASASSREGGDELSSETSELDITNGSIPDWIRQELANSEPDPGVMGGPEDSELSESDDSQTRPPRPLATKPRPREAKPRPQETKPRPQEEEGTEVKSPESGVDVAAGHSTSSTSSEYNGARPRTVSTEPQKSKLSITRKMSAPANPVRGKQLLPKAGQKPLNRLRAKGRNRADSPSAMLVQSPRDSSMEREVCRLREEKERIEERMQVIETHHKEVADKIRAEAETEAREREERLMQQIESLQSQLQEQTYQLQSNRRAMTSMQEQLHRVTTSQSRPSTGRSTVSTRSQSGSSKICCVM